MNKKRVFSEVRSLLVLGIGAGIAQLSQVLINLFDSAMMGNKSSIGLAAGLLGSSIYHLGLLFCMGVTVSITIIISRSNRKQEKKIIASGYLMVFILSIVMALYLLLVFKYIGSITANKALANLTKEYLIGLMPGIFPWLLFLMVRNILACHEKVKMTAILSIVSVGLDMVLNYLLIFGGFGFKGFGILGSAYSTSLTNWVTLIICGLLIYFSKEKSLRSLLYQFEGIDKTILITLLKLGIPTGIIYFSEYLIITCGNSLLANYGVEAVIAFGVAMNWLNLFYMLPVGLSQILTIKFGESITNQNREIFKRRLKSVSWIIHPYNLFCVGCIQIFKKSLILLIIGEKELGSAVFDLSSQFLNVICVLVLVYNLTVVFSGILRGFGDVKTPLYMVFLMYWIIGVGSSFIFSIFFKQYGILLGMILGFTLTFIGMYSSFKKKKEIFLREEGYH